jgi:hypothetical protein
MLWHNKKLISYDTIYFFFGVTRNGKTSLPLLLIILISTASIGVSYMLISGKTGLE